MKLIASCFLVGMMMVVLSCKTENEPSSLKIVAENPGKLFWKDKPFVVFTMASSEYPIRDSVGIILTPVLKKDNRGSVGIRLLGRLWTMDRKGFANEYYHGTDVVAKIIEPDDFILFDGRIQFEKKSEDDSTIAMFDFFEKGQYPLYAAKDYQFQSNLKKYDLYMVMVDSSQKKLQPYKIVNYRDIDDFLINGCRKNFCNVYTSNVCWRKNIGECNDDAYKNFEVYPKCDWISYKPFPKANKSIPLSVPILGYLFASKEGLCKISYRKGKQTKTIEVESVFQGDSYHIYLKSMYGKGSYKPYPGLNVIFDDIDNYLKQNGEYENY